jgi:DNA internalization-related competence protein ComEC/Rec2
MKRPLVTVALLYTAGVLLGEFWPLPLTWLLALSLGMALVFIVGSSMRPHLLALLIVIAGWTNQVTRTAIISPYDLRSLVGANAEIVALRGRLCETPDQRVYERHGEESWRTLARLEVSAIRRGTNWMAAFGRVAATTPGVLGTNFFGGRTVEVDGVIRLPKSAAAEGLFDYRTFLRRQGIYYQLQVETIDDWRVVLTRAGSLRPPFADGFRNWSKQTLEYGLPAQDESLRLTWAMALGWTTALTGEISQPFMRTGTMHIFAISGLHIALIAGILVALLRVLQIPRGPCGWLVVPLIWFYTAATGWQPSAIRSTIMMTVIIIGWTLRRPSDLLNSLAAAGFIILLWDPQQLFQASFQLSFFVVLSIALLLPPIEKIRQHLFQIDPWLPPELRPQWRRWLDTPIHFVTTSFATSLAAWLGSLPLIAYYFHLFTPISLLANLVIVPLSGFALACNLGSLLCAWWPWLGGLFNHSGWFWMTAMIKLSDWFTAWPGAYFYVKTPQAIVFAGYYVLLFGTVTGWLFVPKRRAWTAASVGLLAVVGFIHWHTHRADVRITVLPLNGGDSIFVDGPGRANDLLVDCGNESAAQFVVEPWLHAQGVNRLPQLLLTHGDLRHIGGMTNIVGEFGIAEVLTSSVRFRSSTYRRVVASLGSSKARPREVNRGDRLGNWAVVHPAAGDRFAEADDNALVLHGEYHGARVLLCSDLGRPGQRVLLEREPDLRADVLVCGIPARGEPLSDALLDAVLPRVIVVSASEAPAQERATKELRERLARRGVPVFYTGDGGAVTVIIRPNSLEVQAMGNRRERVSVTKAELDRPVRKP